MQCTWIKRDEQSIGDQGSRAGCISVPAQFSWAASSAENWHLKIGMRQGLHWAVLRRVIFIFCHTARAGVHRYRRASSKGHASAPRNASCPLPTTTRRTTINILLQRVPSVYHHSVYKRRCNLNVVHRGDSDTHTPHADAPTAHCAVRALWCGWGV